MTNQYEKLADRNYEEAFGVVDAALKQIEAYLALTPKNHQNQK